MAAANTTAMLLDVGGNLDETVDAESEVDAIDGVLPKLMKALLTLKQFKLASSKGLSPPNVEQKEAIDVKLSSSPKEVSGQVVLSSGSTATQLKVTPQGKEKVGSLVQGVLDSARKQWSTAQDKR